MTTVKTQTHESATDQQQINPVLEVKNLETGFFTQRGFVKAVNGVSFSVNPGETLGIVGESGCGKSVTAMSILRLIQDPPGRILNGEILFQGKNLLKIHKKEMENIRGDRISMIFQEPLTALNPVMTVGYQLTEGVRRHRRVSKREAHLLAVEMFKRVGIPDAKSRLTAYPHQLSGGMRQRVMIAMALACEPKLLIADEPTTALDVTVQAQILELLIRLREEVGTSIIMITHDLGVIAEIADRVAVMYAGNIIETAPTRQLFRNPMHPYTIGLIRSIPRIVGERSRITTIPGMVPSLWNLPKGCRFAPRCTQSQERCTRMPELHEVEAGHMSRCWNALRSQDRTLGGNISEA